MQIFFRICCISIFLLIFFLLFFCSKGMLVFFSACLLFLLFFPGHIFHILLLIFLLLLLFLFSCLYLLNLAFKSLFYMGPPRFEPGSPTLLRFSQGWKATRLPHGPFDSFKWLNILNKFCYFCFSISLLFSITAQNIFCNFLRQFYLRLINHRDFL